VAAAPIASLEQPGGISVSKESFEQGRAIQSEIFGEEFVKRAWERQTDLTRPFQELLISFCFGEVWSRPNLTRAERSMVTISQIIALNRPEQLRNHVRGAIANGLTKEKIIEIVIHSFAYVGAPLSVNALATCVDEFQKMGLVDAPKPASGAKP
jgi:4-carboxymuconolactone decarboxylase